MSDGVRETGDTPHGNETTVEAQLKCDCGERDLVVTWTDAVEVGSRTRVKMPCSECESLERTVTVVYDPEEYDLVDVYGDGDIGLRATCQGCDADLYGPVTECPSCGWEKFDRWMESDRDV